MDWMIIDPPTLEEELHIEATLREIRTCEDLTVLRGLCIALTQQGWHQAKLLKQAVHHIASLDESMATLDR
jgi:hypothetical protein